MTWDANYCAKTDRRNILFVDLVSTYKWRGTVIKTDHAGSDFGQRKWLQMSSKCLIFYVGTQYKIRSMALLTNTMGLDMPIRKLHRWLFCLQTLSRGREDQYLNEERSPSIWTHMWIPSRLSTRAFMSFFCVSTEFTLCPLWKCYKKNEIIAIVDN